jgi:hypothetical protein
MDAGQTMTSLKSSRFKVPGSKFKEQAFWPTLNIEPGTLNYRASASGTVASAPLAVRR